MNSGFGRAGMRPTIPRGRIISASRPRRFRATRSSRAPRDRHRACRLALPAEDHPPGQAHSQQVGTRPWTQRVTRRAARNPRRHGSDNPKMRERDLAAQLGISEAELVAAALRRRRRAHRAARRRSAHRTGSRRRGDGADAQRKRRARKDRRLRQGRHRQAQRHGAGRRHRPAHLPDKLGAWLCRREARRRRRSAAACSSSTRRARPCTRCICARPPTSRPIRGWSRGWRPPISRQPSTSATACRTATRSTGDGTAERRRAARALGGA